MSECSNRESGVGWTFGVKVCHISSGLTIVNWNINMIGLFWECWFEKVKSLLEFTDLKFILLRPVPLGLKFQLYFLNTLIPARPTQLQTAYFILNLSIHNQDGLILMVLHFLLHFVVNFCYLEIEIHVLSDFRVITKPSLFSPWPYNHQVQYNCSMPSFLKLKNNIVCSNVKWIWKIFIIKIGI